MKMEVGKAKSDSQQKRAKNAYKSFEKMVNYCESIKCGFVHNKYDSNLFANFQKL